MNIELIPLTPCDRDLSELVRIHSEPSVTRYISISENYFEYVTTTKGVVYYKIIVDNRIAGGIHCERENDLLSLSICIDEEHRGFGIAEYALRLLFADVRAIAKAVEVSIEDTNYSSIHLFEKLGFIEIGKEDELTSYRLALS